MHVAARPDEIADAPVSYGPNDGRPAVPAEIADPLITEFRRAVRCGLSLIRRVPGPAATTKQPVGRLLLECLRDREADVLRFTTDTRIWPTNNTSERDLRVPKGVARDLAGGAREVGVRPAPRSRMPTERPA